MSQLDRKTIALAFVIVFALILGAACGGVVAALGATTLASVFAGAATCATVCGLGIEALDFLIGDDGGGPSPAPSVPRALGTLRSIRRIGRW